MNRISDEKIKAIATEYLTNGMIKTKALISVGYSKNYAEHGGLKLFDNDRLKDEIAHQQAKIELKNDITVASLQNRLMLLAEEAEKAGKLSVAKSCIDSLLKTIGGFQADSPTDKEIELRQIDNETRREIAKVLDKHINSKYLAARPDVVEAEDVVVLENA
jgi:phage terminase small subunit